MFHEPRRMVLDHDLWITQYAMYYIVYSKTRGLMTMIAKEPLPKPDARDCYYFITLKEGGWRDLEAMYEAEDIMNEGR